MLEARGNHLHTLAYLSILISPRAAYLLTMIGARLLWLLRVSVGDGKSLLFSDALISPKPPEGHTWSLNVRTKWSRGQETA